MKEKKPQPIELHPQSVDDIKNIRMQIDILNDRMQTILAVTVRSLGVDGVSYKLSDDLCVLLPNVAEDTTQSKI